jgi:protein-S-isoprenylcysteine O-methyltransferase Ste14
MTDGDKDTGSTATIMKVLASLTVVALVAALAGYVFVTARRLDWTLGWIYLGMVAVALAVNLACLLQWNSVLIERRMRIGKWAKTWDKVWAVLFTLAVIAIIVVVKIEAQDGASKAPGPAWLLGLAFFVPGWALITWSMVVNPFFEKTVRIQTDQGHHVIDKGPYAFVRHPGYTGMVGWTLSTPLLLASYWAFIPALLAVATLVMRTALEDRTLKAELPGYGDYADRVRFRLIPGIW